MLKKIVCMVISAFMLVSLITVFDTSEVSAANTLPASLVQRAAVCMQPAVVVDRWFM